MVLRGRQTIIFSEFSLRPHMYSSGEWRETSQRTGFRSCAVRMALPEKKIACLSASVSQEINHNKEFRSQDGLSEKTP